MATRYTVATGHEFNYPNESDNKIIKAAGGRSKMLAEDLAKIKFKTVVGGGDCSDMPKEAFALYLERGWIIDNKAIAVEEKEEIETVAAKVTTEEEDING